VTPYQPADNSRRFER